MIYNSRNGDIIFFDDYSSIAFQPHILILRLTDKLGFLLVISRGICTKVSLYPKKKCKNVNH